MEKVPAGLPESWLTDPASTPGSAPLLPGASWCWMSICNALGGFALADGPCRAPESLALAQHHLCHPPAQGVVLEGYRQPCPTLLPPSKVGDVLGQWLGAGVPAGGMLRAAGVGAVLGDGWEKEGDERCSAR